MTLRDYQLRAVLGIRDAFRSGRSAPLLVAPTGCLSGDTMIAFNHAGKGAKMRLDLFVDRMRGISSPNSPWDTSIPCFVRAPFPDGTVKLARAIGATYSGVKRVYQLTLESGHTVVGTKDHRILTSKGYVELGKLAPCHFVLVDGGIQTTGPTKPKGWYKLKRIPEHPFAARRGVNPKKGGWTVALHRLAAEAKLNGMPLESFMLAVKSGDTNLKYLDPKVWCVHHIDENKLNNDPSNLQVLTHVEHSAAHEPESKKRLESKLIPSRVVSVTKLDQRATYDLEIEGVHAFTANGIAVHNSGKTRIGLECAARTIAAGKRVVWLAHRQELVEQTYDAATSLGIEAGIVSSVQSRPVRSAPLQIAMMQTLLARELRPEADLAICDEAHHLCADEWRGLAEQWPKRIGLSATPERADGRGLRCVFDTLIVAAQISELVAAGHLVGCDVVLPAKPLESGQLAQHPVAAWREHCKNRKTIVFAPTIEKAEEWAHGLGAVVIHSKMPWYERQAGMDMFRMGRTPTLINVGILTEGFDDPSVDAIILARGCGSAALYLQIVGRALRPAPGKTRALLIDLRGVTHVHGHPEAAREYSLDGQPIRPKDGYQFCACCGTALDGGYPCPSCGYEPEGNAGATITVTNDPLVKFAAMRAQDDTKRHERVVRWLLNAMGKGHNVYSVAHKFKAVYGAPPPRALWDAALVVARKLAKGAA